MYLIIFYVSRTQLNFPDNLRDISGISMQAELLVGSEADRQCKFLC